MKEAASTEQQVPLWSRLGTWLILLVGAVISLGLLSTSYSACLCFLLGISGVFVIWTVRAVLYPLANRVRRWVEQEWDWLRDILLAIICLLCLCRAAVFLRFGAPGPPPVVLVKEYVVFIEPIKPDLSALRVRERAVLFDAPDAQMRMSWTVSPPAREVTSAEKGLVLREVSFVPLESAALGRVVLRTHACRSVKVQLRDFPIKSFFAARDAESLEHSRYVDTETITWSVCDLARGVVFSYIPPPFQHFRPVLAPFIGVASLGQWLVGLVGFIVAVLVTPIVKPVVLGLARGKFKSWLKKEPTKRTKRVATLIISGRGEEKEIEIVDEKH